MENREYFNLEPLGVLAVERTQDCVGSLRRQAAELQHRAKSIEEQARKAEEQTLAALSVELGVRLPNGAAFRLVGSVLEITWVGPAIVAAEDPHPQETPAAPTPTANEDQADAADIPSEPEAVPA